MPAKGLLPKKNLSSYQEDSHEVGGGGGGGVWFWGVFWLGFEGRRQDPMLGRRTEHFLSDATLTPASLLRGRQNDAPS